MHELGHKWRCRVMPWSNPVIPLWEFGVKEDSALLFDLSNHFSPCGVDLVENIDGNCQTGFKALRQAGIHTVPQCPIAGRFLDLAILTPKKVDIEVDGEALHRTSGGGRKDDDHWRDL